MCCCGGVARCPFLTFWVWLIHQLGPVDPPKVRGQCTLSSPCTLPYLTCTCFTSAMAECPAALPERFSVATAIPQLCYVESPWGPHAQPGFLRLGLLGSYACGYALIFGCSPDCWWRPSTCLPRGVLNGKKKKVFRFPKKARGHSMCSTMVGGSRRLAVGGGWRLAVGNWRLVAVGGGWRRLVAGGWWLEAVGSGWQLAVGRRWRLVAVGGGWWLAVGGGWWLAVGGGWQLMGVGGWRLVVPWGGP